MPAYIKRHAALRLLLIRAMGLYLILRIIAIALGAIAGSNGAGLDNPVGLVILVAVLGAIDVRRRNEQMLWRNLGYESWQTWSVFGGVALLGELTIALLSR